ncbi:cobalamin-binding protein [Anabaena aphanizomenioides LEGE 00250]|jgi:iron complex transport system substrate-binding protein|uniref:Cobalamin-binding protein n=1 Tax=Sphaerospermopsis aphanizomenoides LEGE 00250 TaxID=2777972 RepID=A0ABR9VK96_9CYAN|nr:MULTISPECIES: cobalamin-binding protein [Sphaerospermopsis]MBC5797306.1 cobalamin-binding protein [Sphaerospermopsis sp. LEGE 00249]MBE9238912.1 cobalamin-binding protein [Sphaerospermopsis aphanizomenoides LEGE 00250]
MIDTDIKIVSLIPSATEIAATLGLQNAIVGRSHECDYPPEISHLPVCTQARLNGKAPSNSIHDQVNKIVQSALSIYNIKLDVLEKLQPTHILTQAQCDVCAVSLPEVEKAVTQLTHSSPQIISLQPNTLRDVWGDIERIGQTFGVDSVKILENLEARVKICNRKVQGLSVAEMPTVACIEWTDPVMTAANWIPELVNLAGGQTLFSVTGKPSALINWETLVATNPDVIIFMPCGFNLQRTQQEAKLLTQRPEWEKLHAVKTGRVFITDGNAYFNRPGPRLVDSVEILAEILHPEIFDYGYQGTGWQTLHN